MKRYSDMSEEEKRYADMTRGERLEATLLKKFDGDKDKLKAWRQSIGRKGGESSTGGGFAWMRDVDPERHKEISSKGGKEGL